MHVTLKATPRGSLSQAEAAEYVGGMEPLRTLETHWGLRPWDGNATRKRYRVSAIEEAMARAESHRADFPADQSIAAE